MKLEVGMYVKTKNGYICKIINVNDFREPNMKYGVEANYLKDVMFIGDDDVVKASYNIIDVLEVGDYVNGYEVTSKDQFLGFGNHDWYMTNDEIRSIVTKEQFSQMEYKVGEWLNELVGIMG